MDSKFPSQEDPPPIGDNVNKSMDESHCELTDSLNRLTLATATTTALPPSPRLSDASSHLPLRPAPVVPLQSTQSVFPPASTRFAPTIPSIPAVPPVPAIPKNISTPRGERRKSLPALQKRKSAASLRSASGPQNPNSPIPDTSRRTSPTSGGSPTTGASLAMQAARLAFGPVPEPPAPTPVSVAAEHFAQELALHQSSDLPTKIAVILHDACYGHRYERLDAKQTQLDGIVERPERIRACTIGVAMAYVRLGLRHSAEKFAPNPHVPLDEHNVPFRILKTDRKVRLTEHVVTNVHETKWMSELKWMAQIAEKRLLLESNEVARQHTTGDDGLAMSGPPLSESDLYLCAESLNAFEAALGGVCDGVDAVFNSSTIERVFVCIRPPGHHCSANFPSGFCWINNVHVGISHAVTNYGLTHAAILDFDLHHGDGSQDITFDHNSKILNKNQQGYYKQWEAQTRTQSPELAQFRNLTPYEKAPIGYYSLHDINSFPCEGGDREKVLGASLCIDNAHNQSIWNVHLENWDSPDEFWKLYRTKYITLLAKTRNFLRHHSKQLLLDHSKDPASPLPKAAIFISAGFDASEWEGRGMQRHTVNVPTEFYARFTADVVRMSKEEDLGVDGRVISVLEGGYSDRALSSGVLGHLAGLGEGTGPVRHQPDGGATGASAYTYNPEWWAPSNLAELDTVIVPKKGRPKAPTTYLAPTESFSAKVVGPGKERKSSGEVEINMKTPPVPEVGWAIATSELCKQLIPARQTASCRPIDLTGAATARRRQLSGDTSIADAGRQLRARKQKSETPTPATPVPRTPRRGRRTPKTTIAVTTVTNVDELSPSVGAIRRRSSRPATPRRGLSPQQRLRLRMPSPGRGRQSSGLGDAVRSGRVSKSPPMKREESG